MMIICDLDGTLVRCEDRLHFIKDPATGLIRDRASRDWPAFHYSGTRSGIFLQVKKALCLLWREGRNTVHIVTGRPEPYRGDTNRWLMDYGVPCQSLIMRGAEDFRSDIEFKGEIFQEYPVEDTIILEDRDTVVHMARTMGFTVFQVADGAF